MCNDSVPQCYISAAVISYEGSSNYKFSLVLETFDVSLTVTMKPC